MLEICPGNAGTVIKRCAYCAIVYTISIDRPIDCQFICPKCSNALIQVRHASDVFPHYTNKNITLSELYAAMNGFGLPEESKLSEDLIRNIILHGQIKDVFTSLTVNDRVIIDRLVIDYESEHFEMFFESSGFGAVIYKMKRSKL